MENVKQNNSFIKENSYLHNSTNKGSMKNSTSLIKSSSTRNLGNKNCISDIFKSDTSFEHSLRNYKNAPTRIFKNYSKPRGNYFDPKFQYGGESILNRNIKNNRSKTISINDSRESIIKNTNHSMKN